MTCGVGRIRPTNGVLYSAVLEYMAVVSFIPGSLAGI